MDTSMPYTQRHDTIRPFHPDESGQVVALNEKSLTHENPLYLFFFTD